MMTILKLMVIDRIKSVFKNIEKFVIQKMYCVRELFLKSSKISI